MILLLIYILHFWLLNAFFKCFIEPRKAFPPIHKTFIWICFFVVQFLITGKVTNAWLHFIINCIFTIILSFVMYQAPLRKKIFVSLSSCTLGMLFEIIVALLLFSLDYVSSELIYIGPILTKLLMLSFIHGVSIFKRDKSKGTPSVFLWVLLITVTVSSTIIIHTLYLLTQDSSTMLSKNLSFICMLLLLLINIIFFIFEDKLSKSTDMKIENLIMSQQIKRYEELRIAKKEQLHFFNREKHNLKNQLLSIRAYALNEDNQAIIDFISNLLNEADFGLAPVSICDNLIIDAILSSKLTVAKRHHIHYTWALDIPSQLPINDIDLCILIGNAVENAFDACIDDNNQNKFCHIIIKYQQGCLHFHFKNSYFHQIQKTKTSFLSTKSTPTLHGYGLPSIQSIVSKYDGTFDIESNENVFSLKIMLYLN